jgi:hypothetical protein
VLIALILGLSLYFVGSSESMKECVSGQPHGHASQPAQKGIADHEVVFISRYCWGDFVETNDKALVVIGTVALVLVTGILALYTARLWNATKELAADTIKAATDQADLTPQAVEISRQEFLSTHRPRIRIRQIYHDSSLESGQIRLTLANIGDSPATIVATKTAHWTGPASKSYPTYPPTSSSPSDT